MANPPPLVTEDVIRVCRYQRPGCKYWVILWRKGQAGDCCGNSACRTASWRRRKLGIAADERGAEG